MKIVQRKRTLSQITDQYRSEGKSIGFVPTMGGLHAGHLSLVRRSLAENDITVVSLFLNPTQFNNATDYKTYPHDTEADLAALQAEGVDVVFVPHVVEMYDAGEVAPEYPIGHVAEVMEGEYRPGHFKGVVWVVSKLFKLVKPHRAYFGEKDFQQIAVVRRLVEVDPEIDVEVIPCPVVREEDGLAMSTRNGRLSPEERTAAPRIYAGLQMAVRLAAEGRSVAEVIQEVTAYIDADPKLRVEYFEVADAKTLEAVRSWDEAADVVGCITVYCGEVRLIDHIHLK